jgi:hypothetical protein
MTGKYIAARISRHGWWAGMAMIALAACSSDGLGDLRPPADVGSHTASIEPATVPTRIEQEMVTPAEPMASVATEPLPSVEEEMASTAPPMSMPAEEPQPIVMGAPERQLAQVFPPMENPARTLSDAEPDFSAEQMPDPKFEQEPDAPLAAEPEEEPAVEPQPSPRQAMVAYPRIPAPVPTEPEPEAIPSRPRVTPLSYDEIDCRKNLKKLGVRYVDLKPIHDSPSCQIPHPVKVQAIGNVEMRPAATLTCAMAEAFSEWTRKELVPSARMRYFSGIQTIHQGSAYSCRRIARSRTMSAHSQGNALDVMALTLNNGKKIAVKKQGLFAFRAKGLLNNVRADGCEYFTTVLGPGYNWDHRNHFHFDLMQRRNGRRACH